MGSVDFRKMLIPHFLDLSTEDAYTYLRFLKADHQLEDDELEYQLKPADGRAIFNRATHVLRGIFALRVYPPQFFLMSAPDTALVVDHLLPDHR